MESSSSPDGQCHTIPLNPPESVQKVIPTPTEHETSTPAKNHSAAAVPLPPSPFTPIAIASGQHEVLDSESIARVEDGEEVEFEIKSSHSKEESVLELGRLREPENEDDVSVVQDHKLPNSEITSASISAVDETCKQPGSNELWVGDGGVIVSMPGADDLFDDNEVPMRQKLMKLFNDTMEEILDAPISAAQLWKALEAMRAIHASGKVQSAIQNLQLNVTDEDFVRCMATFGARVVGYSSSVLLMTRIEHREALMDQTAEYEASVARRLAERQAQVVKDGAETAEQNDKSLTNNNESKTLVVEPTEPRPAPEEFFDCAAYTPSQHVDALVESAIIEGHPVWLVDNPVFRKWAAWYTEHMVLALRPGTPLPRPRANHTPACDYLTIVICVGLVLIAVPMAISFVSFAVRMATNLLVFATQTVISLILYALQMVISLGFFAGRMVAGFALFVVQVVISLGALAWRSVTGFALLLAPIVSMIMETNSTATVPARIPFLLLAVPLKLLQSRVKKWLASRMAAGRVLALNDGNGEAAKNGDRSDGHQREGEQVNEDQENEEQVNEDQEKGEQVSGEPVIMDQIDEAQAEA